MSHLGSSLPVSVRRCWPSFVSGGVVRVHVGAFFVVWVFFIIWGCRSWWSLQLVTWHCHIAFRGCVLWL